MCFFFFLVALCGAISPRWLGRSPWNFHTWLEVWALRLIVLGVGIDPPKISTARTVHRLTQLRSCHACHVTLPRPELQPPNCPQSDLGRRAATRWALPSISSLFLWWQLMSVCPWGNCYWYAVLATVFFQSRPGNTVRALISNKFS